MTANGIAVIDCDGHVMESIPEMAEFMDPSIQRFARFDRPFVAGIPLFPALDGLHYVPEGSLPQRRDPFSQPRERVKASENRMGSAEDWVALLDEAGLERAVLFTSEGLTIGQITQKEYAVKICRAYNDYVYERFRKVDSRLHPMALIPMQDPAAAVLELRRAVKDLGLPGAMVPSTGLPLHAGHELYWPVYEEAANLECVLAWHGGSNRGIGLDTFTDLRASRFLHHPLPLMIAFISLLYSGVFDRYPTFRAAFMEGGAGWAFFLLDRAEREEEFFGPPKPRIPELLERGRVLIGCEGNDMALPYLAKLVGMQAFAYSSDYPHESDLLDVKREIEETKESAELSREEKAALLGENARRFFRL